MRGLGDFVFTTLNSIQAHIVGTVIMIYFTKLQSSLFRSQWSTRPFLSATPYKYLPRLTKPQSPEIKGSVRQIKNQREIQIEWRKDSEKGIKKTGTSKTSYCTRSSKKLRNWQAMGAVFTLSLYTQSVGTFATQRSPHPDTSPQSQSHVNFRQNARDTCMFDNRGSYLSYVQTAHPTRRLCRQYC